MRFDISAGALLIFALAYFFDNSGYTAAILPAAAVHELGHMAAIRLGGGRVRAMSLDVLGLRIDYSGGLYGLRELLAIACGPLAGLLYALVFIRSGSLFWSMSGALSLVLTVFNALPVLPLDGGRLIASLLRPARARAVSRVTALLLCAAAVVVLLRFRSPMLLIPGLWLAFYNFRGNR